MPLSFFAEKKDGFFVCGGQRYSTPTQTTRNQSLVERNVDNHGF